MSRSPMIVRTVPALRRALDGLRVRKATIALVPTMGALHDGHVSLVRLAKRRAAKVIVSIFVNPAQFAPTEDFSSYPRTWKADVAKLTAEKVDLIWNPDVKTMYPDGFATRILTEGPAMAGLEDRFRPHFFGGVTTVVGKLFTQCRPDLAMFGEKDFQQLRVVTQMARDLDLGVKVTGSRTVREADGLAMSSRNVYLSPEERRVAPTLYKAMKASAAAKGASASETRLIADRNSSAARIVPGSAAGVAALAPKIRMGMERGRMRTGAMSPPRRSDTVTAAPMVPRTLMPAPPARRCAPCRCADDETARAGGTGNSAAAADRPARWSEWSRWARRRQERRPPA